MPEVAKKTARNLRFSVQVQTCLVNFNQDFDIPSLASCFPLGTILQLYIIKADK